MRVVQVAQPVDGGVVEHVAQLAAAARAAGWDVLVACPDGALADRAAAAGVPRAAVPMTREPGPADLGAVRRLRPLLAGADVVHLHSSKAGAVGRAAGLALGRRRPATVFTPHAWSWLVGGRLAPAYRGVERLLLPLADVVIAVGPAEAEAGRAVLRPGAGDRIRTIANGIDVDRFTADGPVADRPAEPLLVCTARLSVQKGQDVAVRALAALPGARLRLVGGGPDRAVIERLAAELGVADRVELAGPTADVAPHLRAADVVLVPSRWDGLSLAVLEAMAVGAAVVASTAVGDAALGEAAVLVPPGDPVALAAAVAPLLADPARRRRLGTAAAAHVRAHHDLRAATAATLAAYDDAIRVRGAAAPRTGRRRRG